MDVLLCDDNPVQMAMLRDLLLAASRDVAIRCFSRASDALDFVKSGSQIDLCCLDIIMPDMSGIELAKEIRQWGFSGDIVFLSTSPEYGPESYTVDAFSYLLKPSTLTDIRRLLAQVEEHLSDTDQTELSVRNGGKALIIPHRSICHIEVIRHNVYIRLADGSEARVNATFSEIAADLLADSRFIQCHRSYIVNMQHIAEISKRELVTRTGERIAIPRNYKNVQPDFYRWKFGGAHQ